MWSQISSIRKREGERCLSTHGGRSSQLCGSREELTPVVLLDDSFFQTKTHSFALVRSLVRARAHIHTYLYLHAREPAYSIARGHVLVVRGGCALLGWREGLLIKAHQGRSVSTGGRVVQEHRDAPAAVRRSRQAERAGT